MAPDEPRILAPGAAYLGAGRCRFVVWAPGRRVDVLLLSGRERVIPLKPAERGYHAAVAEGVEPGTLYRLRVDGTDVRPDPASRFQPEGVHGPSQVVGARFPWTDAAWRGRPLEAYAIYEVHVGTFTSEGTFESAVARLDDLAGLGVTAIELMPIAQFPGPRNWGYDGAFPFAVQNSYGGPTGFKRFVDACHARELAVVLDVVYNHVGPEGNALWGLAPYFTDRYKTPWGSALNFDGPWSDEVRRFFIENALMWVREFHVDALRLDAVHAIVDPSARPFVEELAGEVHEAARALGRPAWLFAESDRNDPRLVLGPERGGCGLDAVWNDDFHHALHVLLTGEGHGYYEDFGRLEQLGRAMTQGFVYEGQVSAYRGRRHGAPSQDVGAHRLVVFAQNHDQVGNRMRGERLSALVSSEKLKLAAGAVLLSPNVPLLFMGEEYAETVPFLYFVSHSDPALIEAVRRGRREEFAKFKWPGEPPDPQDEATFRKSTLGGALPGRHQGRALRELYRTLLELRRTCPPLARLQKDGVATAVYDKEGVLLLHREGGGRALAAFNFSDREASITLPARGGTWVKALESSDEKWDGPGGRAPSSLALDAAASLSLAPASFVLYTGPEASGASRAAALAAASGGVER